MKYERIARRERRPFFVPWYALRAGRLARGSVAISVSDEVLATSGEAARLFDECLGVRRIGRDREELWFCGMDDDCRATSVVRVAEGTEDEVRVAASSVLRVAALAGVESFLLAHNHPCGDPKPSIADWIATSEISGRARAVGLELVDHLVLGAGVYVSMRSLHEPLFSEGWGEGAP